MSSWPENVGIIAIELVFPSQYVDQVELEKFDGVATGKYTIGLGQSKMGFCSDREDINSLCLTVVSKLVKRNNLNYKQIGRLDVGTETIIDKSKSVKTVLMQLFEESGNYDVEGIDTTNACYGGTAALFNALSWVESSAWDGRFAVVVCADIAVYASGNARPTGGAGAIAMLVGANAPLVIERNLRATYMRHTYDFYKPDLSSEYPTVDGKLSIQCYLSALDNCYQLYCNKAEKLQNISIKNLITLDNFDAVLFHSPYCKLVQKSLARLMLNDHVRSLKENGVPLRPDLEKLVNVKLEETYFDRDIEKEFMQQSKNAFEQKTKPSLLLAQEIGNMYTPSLYGGLVSLLISKKPEDFIGKRICLFSYGSGLASSMYSMRIVETCGEGSPLNKLVDNLDYVHKKLELRKCVPPSEFSATMKLREQNHHKAPYTPIGAVDDLFPGTWYLDNIDEMHRRSYKQVH